ncbi:MAG: YceI family protein [Flavobacteriales bacterium]|nr:YceI family protein [Flavobacteriales bacterium]
MKKFTLVLLSIALSGAAFSQEKYFTRDGHIKFFSSTPMENIEADNHKVTVVLDEATGKLEFSALMKSFEFEKALMEEHFNENYVESKTYPKATFKGSIKDFEMGAFDSEADVVAVGKLTIHGVTKDVEMPGKVSKSSDGYQLTSKFNVNPEDYNIEIPKTVRDNIAEQLEVTVDSKLGPLKK